MKARISTIAAITTIIIVYTPTFTLTWAVASFLLYLFKDIPFAWWSVIAYLVSKVIKVYISLFAKRATLSHKSDLARRIEEVKRRNQTDF